MNLEAKETRIRDDIKFHLVQLPPSFYARSSKRSGLLKVTKRIVRPKNPVFCQQWQCFQSFAVCASISNLFC